MSDQTTFDVLIFSPRWGHDDVYEVQLTKNQMKIGRKADPNPSICTWHEGADPTWSTDFPQFTKQNPVESTLQNDHIYPPTIFVWALEAAWRAWRQHELTDEEVHSEMSALCDWVSAVAKNRPRTAFWKRIF